MVLESLKKFKAEQIKWLSLGLAPETKKLLGAKHDFLTHYSLRLLYNYGNHFFNFKGLYKDKEQFGGIVKPSFIATNRRFSLFESAALVRYMGII